MACVAINETTAVVEWQWEGATRNLATADPDHDAIRFTLRLDPESQYGAHFEISIPFRFKDKPAGAGVCLRINPFFIKSFAYSDVPTPPDAVKQIFDATTYLDFTLDNTITILIPSDVEEPVVAARARSGKVLDLIHELSCITSLRIYIQQSLLSPDELKSISEAVEQCQIKPSSDPDYDISRMFSGSGAKVTTIPPPKPPSYKKATKTQPPPNAPSNRKRPRQDSHPEFFSQFWDKLQKLEAKVDDLQTDNAKLRADNAQLKDKVARLEKKYEGLEQGDAEETVMIEIRDDISSLDHRVKCIEDARDEDFEDIKEGVFDELAKRLIDLLDMSDDTVRPDEYNDETNRICSPNVHSNKLHLPTFAAALVLSQNVKDVIAVARTVSSHSYDVCPSTIRTSGEAERPIVLARLAPLRSYSALPHVAHPKKQKHREEKELKTISVEKVNWACGISPKRSISPARPTPTKKDVPRTIGQVS
ncbi:hypothetical protein FOC1_g10006405 [Fusarium oxysporum f. sp. cubense race 1]|uniref:Uncharacterized protein n=1 Tax=Fusarium oxysporum f. sp. cubense (strain race 1) TaxID=1229664 RepID=N4TJX1_FUSC1|nr:hypothetical protein FOC1_g10006405 [Fusarium oxysporum f. sp. cubense race 1]